VVKHTGDGGFIEFRSVIDTVRRTFEPQNGLIEHNSGPPAERRIEFRVGIRLGDVVEESDGVNIAAHQRESPSRARSVCPRTPKL
jgi:hypothetical protein